MQVIDKKTHLNNSQSLSEREVEVLQLAANGKSNKQTADMLNVCKATIDTHTANIVAKLKAKNMKHAVAIGIRKKIIK